MLEKALFVANFSWIVGRKLLSEDAFVSFSKSFDHGCRTDNVLKALSVYFASGCVNTSNLTSERALWPNG